MLSRVADALFWTSRYVERAENVARLLDANLTQALDAGTASRESGWEALVSTTGDMQWFQEHHGTASKHRVMHFLTFDREYPNSIVSAVSAARGNAQAIRGIISREMWQAINELYLYVEAAERSPNEPEDMGSFYERVKLAGSVFGGATDATLSRGEAWHFLRMGSLMERADKTSRLLDVKYFLLLPEIADVGTTLDQVGWVALLESASALQMYLQKHHVVAPRDVAGFLIFDRDFPRALRFCIDRAADSLSVITGNPPGGARTQAERLMGRLRASLEFADAESVVGRGLHEYLDEIQGTLNAIDRALNSSLFDYSI